jgi:predicted metal-dependent hydrolase
MKDLVIPFKDRNIIVTKRRNLKSLSLRIKPFSDFRLNVPYGVPVNVVNEFIASKEQWMDNALIKIKEIESKDTFIIEDGVYKTKYHQLEIKGLHVRDITFNIDGDKALISYPISMRENNSDYLQETISNCVIELWRFQAKKVLTYRVFELATEYGFSYNKVFIKNLKSKWGSCSSVNNINLNLFLMNIPDYLTDYVILHELVHTKVKNHSAEFWDMLNKYVPDAKKVDKELKNYSLNVTLEKV